jgi:poly(A) polymerase
VIPARKITPPRWMRDRATRAVIAALTKDGAAARFVGGCVRDAVAGRAAKDIDIATPLAPSRVMELLAAARLRAIPTGIEHGTVTAIADGKPLEVTTLRRDVETFGRHARVEFTGDWEADAARRDFTMNALYADADGTIYDPAGGLEDLARGRVRFVGDACARIEEDVLRLLRFFRFHAYYGRGAPDRAALAACRAFAPRVADLSGERVRAELFRLLEAKDPARITALMARHGVLRHVVPGFTNHKRLAAVAKREARPDALRRLAAGLSLSARKVDALADRLRLSNAERARLAAMLGAPRPTPRMTPAERRRLLYRIGPEAYRDRARLAGYPQLAASRLKPPRLPLQGRDLVALGVKPGPQVGRLLGAVERWWINRDFKPRRAQCLQYVQRLMRGHGTASRTIR